MAASQIDLDPSEDMNHFLLLVDRSGSGWVHFLTLNSSGLLANHKVRREKWAVLEGLVDFGTEVVDNKLYVIGGKKSHHGCWDFTDTVIRYDPVEASWEERAPMNLGRANCTTTKVKNLILVAGGEKPGGVATGSCELYNPALDHWDKAGMLPEARKCHASLADGDTVYVSGGASGRTAHDNIWVYEDNRWQDTDEHYPNALLWPVEKHCMVMCDHIIYFLGGLQHDSTETEQSIQASDSLMSFCPRVPYSQDSQDDQPDRISPWTWKLPPMPHPRQNAAACLLGRQIHVFGGVGPGSTAESVQSVDTFDVDRQEWTSIMKLKKGDFRNVSCIRLDFPKLRKPNKVLEVMSPPPDPPHDIISVTPGRWVLW